MKDYCSLESPQTLKASDLTPKCTLTALHLVCSSVSTKLSTFGRVMALEKTRVVLLPWNEADINSTGVVESGRTENEQFC